MPASVAINAVETSARSRRFRNSQVRFVFVGLLMTGASVHSAPDFSRDVRPILEAHCLKCHGPEKQKGGLRFDLKEGAFKTGESGEKAIVPGDTAQSRLFKLISSKD